MTLIELLAGLVVLGTVLASVTLARARFLRQSAEAEQRIAVTRAVDEMLSAWLSGSPQRIPIPGHGELPGMRGHTWQTMRRRDANAESLGAQIVRLEVRPRVAGAKADRSPLVSVEFLLPHTEEPR